MYPLYWTPSRGGIVMRYGRKRYHSYIGKVGNVAENLKNRDYIQHHCAVPEVDNGCVSVQLLLKQVLKEYTDYYNNNRLSKKKWIPPVVYREASICAA